MNEIIDILLSPFYSKRNIEFLNKNIPKFIERVVTELDFK